MPRSWSTPASHPQRPFQTALTSGSERVWVGADPGIIRVDPIDGDEPGRSGSVRGPAWRWEGAWSGQRTLAGVLYGVDPNTAEVEEEVEVGTNTFDIAVGLGAI